MTTAQDSALIGNELAIVSAWCIRVIHDETGSTVKSETMEDVLTKVLGRKEKLTFGRFRAMEGSVMVRKLEAVAGIEVPEQFYRVFQAFATTWDPMLPHCPACTLPALKPNANLTGLDSREEGKLCPWCEEKHVTVRKYKATYPSWITGTEVPDTMDYDTETEATKIPISEAELSKETSHDFMEMLGTAKLLIRDWMRYVKAKGYSKFGLPAEAFPIYQALRSNLYYNADRTFLEGHILQAKKYRDENAAKNVAADIGPRTPVNAIDLTKIWPLEAWDGPHCGKFSDAVTKACSTMKQVESVLAAADIPTWEFNMSGAVRHLWFEIIQHVKSRGKGKDHTQ